MKAKLYTLGLLMEVAVSNKRYPSLENETKKDFLKRVNGLLEKDFDEAIDIVEIKNETIAALDDNMLTQAYMASKGGLQEQILKGLLEERKISVEKIEKTSRKKVEMVDKEVAKSTEAYKTAKSNVGKLISFKPAKSEDVVSGIIKSISFNKTNTIIYYNVAVGTQLKCCTATNETIQLFEV